MSAAEAINYTEDRNMRYQARAVGINQYTHDIKICPVVTADLRRDTFAKVEDWPKDKPNPLDKLTDAPSDVVGLVALGMSNAEIAHRISVTEPTVKYHLGHVFKPLGAKNRTQVGERARKAGIFTRAVDSKVSSHGGDLKFRATKAALLEVEFADQDEKSVLDELAPAERNVLDYVVHGGFSNGEIAISLCVAEQTVKFHLHNAYKKMNLTECDSISQRSRAAALVAFEEANVKVKYLPGMSQKIKPAEVIPFEGQARREFRGYLGELAAQEIVGLSEDKDLCLDRRDLLPRRSLLAMAWPRLRYLRHIGVITEEMTGQGWIDLPAAILERQIGSSYRAAEIITHPEYQDLAVEVATKAARDFYRSKILRAV